jgi:hypothetical protein
MRSNLPQFPLYKDLLNNKGDCQTHSTTEEKITLSFNSVLSKVFVPDKIKKLLHEPKWIWNAAYVNDLG